MDLSRMAQSPLADRSKVEPSSGSCEPRLGHRRSAGLTPPVSARHATRNGSTPPRRPRAELRPQPARRAARTTRGARSIVFVHRGGRDPLLPHLKRLRHARRESRGRDHVEARPRSDRNSRVEQASSTSSRTARFSSRSRLKAASPKRTRSSRSSASPRSSPRPSSRCRGRRRTPARRFAATGRSRSDAPVPAPSGRGARQRRCSPLARSA